MVKKTAAVALVTAVSVRPMLTALKHASGELKPLDQNLFASLSLVKHNKFMNLDPCTPAHLSDQKKRLKQNVVVHVTPNGDHAQLTVGRDYMNFYPQNIDHVSGLNIAITSSSKNIHSVARHPLQSMPRGSVSIELPFINGEPILEFIRKNAGENREEYNLYSNNCATMVAKALMSSTNCRPTVDPTLGDDIPGFGHLIGAQGWTPKKVLDFAKELTELAGEPLRSSVALGWADDGDNTNNNVTRSVAAGTISSSLQGAIGLLWSRR